MWSADLLAEHRPRRRGPLMERVRPVLDADPLAVERVPRVRDVACREDVRRGGLQLRVNDDPVADLQAGVTGQASARHHAYADDGEVTLDPAAAGGPHPRDRAIALERVDPVAGQELDAVPVVHVPVEGCDAGAEDPLVGQRLRVDDGDLKPALARRGGELAAIQPAPTTTTRPPAPSRARS